MKNNNFRTWIEISRKAIKNNYRVFKKLIGKKVKFLAVVKSNAYGHELFNFAKTISDLGADWLGVDSITEAIALRKVGIKKPILVLGYTLPQYFGLAEKQKISLTISNFENLNALIKSRKKVNIHIKIDSGMHRQGFCLSDLEKLCELIKQNTQIAFEGIYTHFAAAKKPDSKSLTQKQISVFNQAIKITRKQGFFPITHAAATAGALNYKSAHYDMVRVGIGMYGLWPSQETKKTFYNKHRLIPALTWKALISELKWIEKGEKIGYDHTETLKRRSLLAIVPIGYWHGYWRAFSGKAFVLINGIRCKIIGRVAMDMVVIDVTDAGKVKVGDCVVLIGKQKNQEISADELADLAGTTHYEIVTKLNPLIKKIYL